MKILILLLLPLFSFAQLPTSGSLSLKSAAGVGRSISQQVDGNETGSKSLTTLSNTAGFTTPHSMLEFRGYPSVPVPGSPSSCTAVEDTPNTDIVFTWTDPSSGAASYFSTTLFENGVQVGGAGNAGLAHQQLLTNPTIGNAYKLRIEACNSSGCSAYCETNEVTYIGITAPSSVVATLGSGSISVSWSGATGSVTNYEIHRNVNSGGYAFLTDDTSSPYVDGSIVSGNTYRYRVRSENSAGSTSFTESNTINYSTPGAPSNVSTVKTVNGIEVGWDPPSSGGDVLNYRVEISEEGSSFVFYENTPGISIIAEDADLTPGLNYQFRVRAENSVGNSSYATGSTINY